MSRYCNCDVIITRPQPITMAIGHILCWPIMAIARFRFVTATTGDLDYLSSPRQSDKATTRDGCNQPPYHCDLFGVYSQDVVFSEILNTLQPLNRNKNTNPKLAHGCLDCLRNVYLSISWAACTWVCWYRQSRRCG